MRQRRTRMQRGMYRATVEYEGGVTCVAQFRARGLLDASRIVLKSGGARVLFVRGLRKVS